MSGIYKLLFTAFDNNQTFVDIDAIYKELTTKCLHYLNKLCTVIHWWYKVLERYPPQNAGFHGTLLRTYGSPRREPGVFFITYLFEPYASTKGSYPT